MGIRTVTNQFYFFQAITLYSTLKFYFKSINESNQIRHKFHIQQFQQLIPLYQEEGIVPPYIGSNNQLQPKQTSLNPSPSAHPQKKIYLIYES